MPSNTVKLIGILTDVFPIETTPHMSKRVIWVKEPDTERYPQHWEIELQGADTRIPNSLTIGDKLEVEVAVRGRKYTKRDRSTAIFTYLKLEGCKLIERLKMDRTTYQPKPGSHDDQVSRDPQAKLGLD